MECEGTSKQRVLDVLFSVALIILVAAAYSPSLKHAPRADQWAYLVDTAHCQNFSQLLAESYSYNRTRVIGPGDTDLFRPLLFLLLATEKHLFGGDFRFAQGIGIGLHCCICLLLLVLLRQMEMMGRVNTTQMIRPLPYGVVAFFALNPYCQELVIWHHLHGYLLFLILLLGSLICLLHHVATMDEEPTRTRWLWSAWGLTLMSAFAYELGQVLALLAGAFLAAVVYPKLGRGAAVRAWVAFTSIVLIYQATNAFDRQVHKGRYDPEDGNRRAIRESAFAPQTATNAARFGVYTGVQPFFPSAFRWTYSYERLLVAEGTWVGAGMRTLGPNQVASYAVFGLATGLVLVGLWQLARARARVPLLTFLMILGLYTAYGAATVLGRMNVRTDPPTLVLNSYYAYTGLLLALLCLCAAWSGVNPDNRWVAAAKTGLLAGLVALSLTGAEQTRQVNTGLALKLRDYTVPLRAVQEFVAQHRCEPDFSFAINYLVSDDIPVQWDFPITETVFARWINSESPKYFVVVRDGKVLPAPTASSNTKATANHKVE